ncbi:MAG TPA: GAF domain-containing protein [Candidatus Eisenbacteria bacterium]|nr:GAF domain-containing protein [Candidatus Eisenbacteria bacterium]
MAFALPHAAARNVGLRRRLLVLGLTFFGAALFINTVAGTYYTRSLIKKSAAALQRETAYRLSHEIEEFMESKQRRLVDFATTASFLGLSGEQQRVLALLLLKNDLSFTEIAVLDANGREVLKVSERTVHLREDLSDQSGSEEFTKAMAGHAYISPVYSSEKAEPFVTLSVPIKLGPSRIIGVVAAEANLKTLWEVIGRVRFGNAGYAYLVDGHGNLIAHRDSSLVLKRLNLAHLREVREFLQTPGAADPTPSEESTGLAGDSVITTYAPLRKLGWAVILEEPVALALKEMETLQRYAIVLLCAGLVVGALVISWASRRITNPIRMLHHGARLVGAGDLDHRVTIDSGDEIEELADAFNRMALELKNSYSNLEQKVEQRTKEIAALYEITTTVNRSLDLESVLQAVIQKITEIFKFDVTRIFLLDPETGELNLRACYEARAPHHRRLETTTRHTIVGKVVAAGEPLFFEDVETDPRYQQWSLSRNSFSEGLRFFAVFPVKTKSRVIGAISFKGRERRSLTEEEIRLLESMSEHIAVAVEKASLFEEVKKRSEHLAVLHTVAAAISQSLDLHAVLRAAIDNVVAALRFDAAWIYLLDSTGRELHLKGYKGLSDEAAQRMSRRSLGSGITGRVIAAGERIVFEDIGADTRYATLTSGHTVRSLGFTATAGFPIRAKDRIIGVLHVASLAKRHFAHDELQLIEGVVQEIGVAVENAILFAKIKEQSAELEKANRELQEATRVKSEFIAAMSHELRTPLNIVLGNAELTGDGFFGAVNPEQREAMRKISYHGRFLLKLINDVLTLSRLEAKKMTLDVEPVDLAEIIAHVQNYVEHLNRDKRLNVRWEVQENLPPVVTDSTKLEEILQNLLGNAFKFTARGEVRIRVRKIEPAEQIEFAVADTGIGIEAKDLERIFNEFEQLNDAHTGTYNGVGLGLSIVRKYLELMGGAIRVESEVGKGSTFTFTIPQVLEGSPRAAA